MVMAKNHSNRITDSSLAALSEELHKTAYPAVKIVEPNGVVIETHDFTFFLYLLNPIVSKQEKRESK